MSYPDSHLQSAIRADERRLVFRDNQTKCPAYLRPYLLTTPIPRESVNIHSEGQYGGIMSEVYNQQHPTLKWIKKHLPSAFEVSVRVVKTTLEQLIPGISLPNIQADEYVSRLLSTCVLWEDLRSRMQSMLMQDCKWTPSNIPLGIISRYYLSGKFLLCNILNIWYVFSYDQVMMISDTIWARCNVLIYHHLLPTGLPGKVPTIYIETCYEIIDREFRCIGNNIYGGIKNWEPIILGSMVEDYDPYDGGVEYLLPVLSDMKTEFPFMVDLYKYLKTLQLSPDQYSELHGLYRHWGHPTVDEPGACKKTRLISQHRPPPNFVTIVESIGCLKRQYAVSFLQKHGRWPLIKNTQDIQNTILKRMVETHAKHLNLYQSAISLKDWYNLEFGKEMEFDSHLDYTELIDDKAVSPYRNEFRSLFNPSVLGYRPPKPRRSRRLLRAILEIHSLNINEILRVIQYREVPKEWLIVILHSKERELKLLPRLFAMMVLEMRMYFVVTEKNIADNIFPYFPQQTMTMSESELSKRIYKFTEVSGPTSYIPFFVMIDFKSWNIHWSELSTFDTFQFLDDIQGTSGLYTYTHEFFANCLMVLSSSLLPPSSIIGDASKHGDPPECETLWYNHLGGWDGLRQKGWTVATIALLLLVEQKTGIQSQIVGQADNQICKILIPRRTDGLSNSDYIKQNLQEIKERVILFTNTLDKVVSDVGLVLKKEESLVSSTFTIYGKEMTYNGAQLSQASKKISRALAEVNTTVPSLHSKTLTMHSAGLSTSQKTHSPFIPCVLANVLSIINFLNGSRYSQLTRHKNPADLWDWLEGENALTFLLLGSGDTGGAPIQNILSYLYRGHPDSLTSYTTYLFLLAKGGNKVARLLYIYFQKRKYPVGLADPELLISNPCSTNIASFPLIGSRYRTKLEMLVQQRTRNKDLRALFPTTSQQNDKDTFKFLLKFRPLQPRLLHEIFRLTPTSSRLSFLAKFSNTRTVHSMMQEMKSSPGELDGDWEALDYQTGSTLDIVVDDIDVGMLAHLKYTYDTIRCESGLDIDLICPTLLAKDLRHYSWRALIEDTPLDGVTIPHPAHQFSLSFPAPGSHSECSASKEYCILTPVTSIPRSILSERGPLPPYIGSKTREKITGKIYTIPTTSRPFKAAERAIILDGWCVDPDSSLHTYLMNIVQSRTDIPEGDLRKIAGRIAGGTSIHRLDSHMGPTSTLNNLLANSTTHILFSTDTMGRFSQGRENYVMHFQGIIHTGISYMTLYIAHNNKVPIVAHLHYVGMCCEEPIDESMVGGHADIPSIPIYPDNPLLYTRVKEQINLRVESVKGVLSESHTDSSWAMAFILLSRIRTRITSTQWGVTETSAPTVSSLGVQEILRIGIGRIVKALAKALYLHFDYDDENMGLLLQSLSLDIWSDLASIVLIPDVLVPTIKYLNVDGIPDAYTNPNMIARLLNRSLIREVIKISGKPSKVFSVPPFHIYGNIRFNHILHMWGKMVYLSSNKRIDLRSTIHEAIWEHQRTEESSSTISQTIISRIITLILQKHGVEGFIHAWSECPLKICYTPPETLLRIDPFPQLYQLSPIKPFTPTKGLYESYPLEITMPPRSDTIVCIPLSYDPGAPQYKQKLRADHMFRHIGQVSTAYLKYMEIILKDNLPTVGTAICTADGEASVGFLLYKLTGNPIIYNSLVDRKRLPPQRGYTYIPGSFLRFPGAVLNAETNSLLGGDITNDLVQDSIIELAKTTGKSSCIITCDAESSIEFSLNLTVDIILSVCRIGYCTQAQSAIIKTYLLDDQVQSIMGAHLQLIWEEIKLVTPCFSSYESTECFWVCKRYNPMIPEYNYYRIWKEKAVIGVPLSYNQAVGHIREYMSIRLSSSSPFQSQRLQTTKMLLKSAELMGFRSNIQNAFYYITNNLIAYDSERSLRSNLEDSMASLMNMMYNYLAGMRCVYEGRPLSLERGAAIVKGRVLHTTIELFAVAYRNVILALKLEELKNDLTTADLFIHTSSLQETVIHDTYGKRIYSYKDTDEGQWRQRYLKSIWKITGSI